MVDHPGQPLGHLVAGRARVDEPHFLSFVICIDDGDVDSWIVFERFFLLGIRR
jgi:hypothetical protein